MRSMQRIVVGFSVLGLLFSTAPLTIGRVSGQEQNSRGPTQRLTGSWDTEVAQDGFPPARRFFTFTSDGAALGTAVLQATPMGVELFGTPHGAWVRTGDRQFIASFVALRQAINGDPTGSFKLRVSMTLNESGTEWDGEFVIEFFLPNGTPLFAGQGTLHASRILPE
jgi:hypothetical protein